MYLKTLVIILFLCITSVVAAMTDLPVKMLSPEISNGDLQQYQLAEFSVVLPEEIMQSIQRYKSSGKIGLNPFNPEHLDVWADFFYEGDTLHPQRVNAFYYESFARNIAPRDSRNWGWIGDGSAPSFHVRFAARKAGNWQVKFYANVAGMPGFESKKTSFVCNQSSGSYTGFMEVGKSQRYFRLSNGSFFFPRGQNMPHVECNGCEDYYTFPPRYMSLESYRAEPVRPRAWMSYEHDMEEIAAAGGNYFRNMLTPWSNSIEFEKLNNYFDRLPNAWEMDQLIEKARTLDLRIHLVLNLQYTLEVPAGFTHVYWDWPAHTCDTLVPGIAKDNGNCYHSELGLQDPVAFFTSREAIKYYKRQVRYIIARWGYSQNIAAFDLFSEINNAGGHFKYKLTREDCYCEKLQYKSYESDSTVPVKVYLWEEEIARYIKVDLQHNDHLVSVSYAGEPAIAKGDSIFYSPYIDFVNFNFYGGDRTKNFVDYSKKYTLPGSVYYTGKPLMHGECGLAGFDYCGGWAEWIKTMWASSFSGEAATAMNWNGHFNNPAWKHFGLLRDFMQGYDFDEGSWLPVYDKRDNKTFAAKYDDLTETTGLVNKDAGKAIGVVIHRGYNYFTQGTAAPCTDSINHPRAPYDQKTDVGARKRGLGKIQLEGFQKRSKFVVSWYDIFTGQLIEEQKIKSNGKGFLVLDHPDLLLLNGFRPLLGYKIEPAD